jgi:hypothetical protein
MDSVRSLFCSNLRQKLFECFRLLCLFMPEQMYGEHKAKMLNCARERIPPDCQFFEAVRRSFESGDLTPSKTTLIRPGLIFTLAFA